MLILGTLLFNVCLDDPFLFVSNSHLSNRVDGNLYVFALFLVVTWKT